MGPSFSEMLIIIAMIVAIILIVRIGVRLVKRVLGG
jgi:hypothetical protein